MADDWKSRRSTPGRPLDEADSLSCSRGSKGASEQSHSIAARPSSQTSSDPSRCGAKRHVPLETKTGLPWRSSCFPRLCKTAACAMGSSSTLANGTASAAGYASAYPEYVPDARQRGRVSIAHVLPASRESAARRNGLPADLVFTSILSKSLLALSLHLVKEWLIAPKSPGATVSQIHIWLLLFGSIASSIWTRPWEAFRHNRLKVRGSGFREDSNIVEADIPSPDPSTRVIRLPDVFGDTGLPQSTGKTACAEVRLASTC